MKATLLAIFFNDFGRPRSGWRFLIFLFSFLLASTLLGAIVFAVLVSLPLGFDQNSLLFLFANHFLFFVCALGLGWLCNRYLEDLPPRALGWTFSDGWLGHLVLGLAFGVFSISLAAGIAYLFGGLKFSLNDGAGSSAIWLTLAISLLLFVGGALSEETVFRGYMMQTFSRSGLTWLGVGLTSYLFAYAHVRNPSANILSWVNTFLAGILFAAGYLKTRTLWFPFALHLTWNWVQGAFFGITVSGLKHLISAPLLEASEAGPAWLTGGEYGIEGGVACTAALALTSLCIWFAPFVKPSEEMLALTNVESAKCKVQSAK